MIQEGLQGRFALDMQGVQRLKHSAARDPEGGLKEASRQFEALFLQVMLKSMRDATPQSDLFSSQQTQFYNSLMDQQWAQQLAGQGFGLADQLTAQLRDQVRANGGATGNREELIVGIPRGEPISLAGRELPTPVRSELPLAEGDAVQQASETAHSSRTMAAEQGWQVFDAPGAPGQESAAVPQHVQDFVQRMGDPARVASRASGIPEELILAQAALETGWGRRGIVTVDGRDSHNVFGIKAGGSWPGETTEVTTHEYIGGRSVRLVQTFRVYESYQAAFADYASLLADNPRYAGVVQATNVRQAAVALQKGGYATDPRYAEKLISVMDLSRASLAGAAGRG